jgi:isopentenyl-diphosphate delta-isomerase
MLDETKTCSNLYFTENNIFTLPELVVLVDEDNNEIGTELKSKVHHKETPLHRGFSIFVFNSKGELLLQQRAKSKVTWPLVWSNSCCGHPAQNEDVIDTAKRRLKDELSLTAVRNIQVLKPDYRYKYEREGVVENEICPILIGFTDADPKPNPDEVEDYLWIKWEEFLEIAKNKNPEFSEWSLEEAILIKEQVEEMIS